MCSVLSQPSRGERTEVLFAIGSACLKHEAEELFPRGQNRLRGREGNHQHLPLASSEYRSVMAAAPGPTLGALGSLGAAHRPLGPDSYVYAADALRRAEQALVPVGDKVELCIRGS